MEPEEQHGLDVFQCVLEAPYTVKATYLLDLSGKLS